MGKINHSHHPCTLGRIKRLHFVGIGGSGMNGIAEVLLNLGYEISGSDICESAVTKHLSALGIKVYIGHEANNVQNTDVVIKSTAVKEDNPEIQAAREKRLPVVPRAQMLAELMRFRYGIAIAGTHGKTTTTSLVTSILAEGGFDPTYVIGGRLNRSGSNAQLGSSRYFVAEADESDASFLYLQPMMSVVTNIDADHMATYQHDFSRLKDTFLEFIHHLPFYGIAIMCVDDPVVRELMAKIARPMITYGLTNEADCYTLDWQTQNVQSHFTVKRFSNHPDLVVTLNLPGRHNVLNALAAIAIATELGVPDTAICNALRKFEGVGRRFQIYGELSLNDFPVMLVDDYGHHPWEITATIAAMRQAWPDRRLVLAFQPHRYSRTQALFEDFIKALSKVDVLLMLDIYSAGEDPIYGIDTPSICNKMKQQGQINPIYVSSEADLTTILHQISQPNDVLLTQGAGNIGNMAAQLAQRFGAKR